ncbi:MLO-like protein [Actinidia chinensis var. chinensis]|uniref:MLO-like protein n=1 Tax=Actinidia chinensis var. chinensis TaxID=1590841 RepID=A0A2R6Q6U5_ACTCC|nr:MLO-like protein [Actinidia chinensis var. chinensis]
MENVIREGRSLEETPTWTVATVTTVMVFVCLLVERSIYRFGNWLRKTRRKALFASLERIKEELMLLGLISLLLGQWASWISEICVNSSILSRRFYICSEEEYGINEKILFTKTLSLNETDIPPRGLSHTSYHQCGEGREPFVSYEGLEQLHRFLFVLAITHVLYSCIAVGLAMSKIYSWRKWENQASLALDANLQARVNKVMKRQSTFVLHHASHPWSRSRILIWMLCFLRQFKSSIQKSDYLALRLGFITNHKLPNSYNFHRYMVRSMEDEFYGIVGISWPLWGYAILCIFINIHGLNIYFWLSFIPAILVMLVGTKLQHVVSLLALETVEPRGQFIGTQVKPSDDLFWFGKPEILLRLIQFISFQNAFEMATFIWSLWGFKQRSCFMNNHAMIIIRLASGVLVQFWCSYSTVPLNVLVTQMGSKCKKAVIAESVRESLHSWCKRVKERSKRDALHSVTTRSTCSLESIIDERDECITIGSGTLSRCSSAGTLDHAEVNVTSTELPETYIETREPPQHEYSFRVVENPLYSLRNSPSEALADGAENNLHDGDGAKVETLFELFQKT